MAMRLLLTDHEMEEEGAPTKSDVVWAWFALAWGAAQGGVAVYRVLRSFLGEPLLVTNLLGANVSVSISGSAPAYAGGMILHITIAAVALFFIWYFAVTIQRRQYWKLKA